MICIKGTEWDRATCASEAALRVRTGELSEPDNHSLDFALWTLELLKEEPSPARWVHRARRTTSSSVFGRLWRPPRTGNAPWRFHGPATGIGHRGRREVSRAGSRRRGASHAGSRRRGASRAGRNRGAATGDPLFISRQTASLGRWTSKECYRAHGRVLRQVVRTVPRMPDAIVGINFGVLGQHSKDESPYCDHAPNPRAVYRYAQARGYQLDNEAFEMIIGRWEIEYRDNYDVEQEDDRDV